MRKRGVADGLASTVNDSSRQLHVRGRDVIVPLKFDDEGNPVERITSKYFRRLSLDDLRFLKVWRDLGWDFEKACAKTHVSRETAARLAKKLQVFREEDARVKALAEIPTSAWVAAQHVENVIAGGTLQESEQKSLAELAKIAGAYKTQANVSITQNVFNLPKLTPETEAALKAIADKEADVIEADVA